MSAPSQRGFHAAFAAALVDRAPDARPAGLEGRAARRFAIYRNNVHRGLSDALIAAYPAVHRLVGEAFFRAMAREFFLAEPTRPASLALYGAGFGDFIEGFAPAASLPYLADVARLERAWLETCHAADALALAPALLAPHADSLAGLRFKPHPAARLVRSAHPVVALWRANRGAAPVTGRVDIPAIAQTALVTRPGLEIDVTALDAAAGLFAASVMTGVAAGEAYRQAVAQEGDFNVETTFATLLSRGALRAIIDGGDAAS